MNGSTVVTFTPWEGKTPHCVVVIVLSIAVGVPVKVSMINYLRRNKKGNQKAINTLILLEQEGLKNKVPSLHVN